MSPPITPLTPLSPKLSVRTTSASGLRNRLPTQMRRCIPLYIACVLFVTLLLNVDLLPPVHAPTVFRRRAKLYHDVGKIERGGFPKKIWQTWKVDPLNFEPRDSNTAKTWTLRNPGYRYEVLTDSNDMAYVEEKFGPDGLNRMDIVDFYRNVNTTIIKADLLRYIVMYADGGVYADIDVEALKPVARFIPDHRYEQGAIDMVVGVEIDQPDFADHPILGRKSQSFCQWTFMARPRLPVMLRLIETIMAWLTEIARAQNVPISEVQLDFDEVISGTGPSAFTAAVLAEMNAAQQRQQGRSRRWGGKDKEITWADFHDLDESKVVGRVLVLDVEAFAAGQGHSDSGNHNARGALVKHHYHASNWPSRHPRFSHPVYGEVERCNWQRDCVRQWDDDVAAFALLSPDEQQKRIAERPPPTPLALSPAQPVFPPPPPDLNALPAA